MSNKEKESSATKAASFQELKEYLDSTDQDERKDSDSDSEYLTRSSLAQQLFARAPEALLVDKSTGDLVEIVEQTYLTLDALIQNPKQAHINAKQSEKYSSIWIAMGDKPFIINSITECIRERGHPVQALLHPIVIHQGFRLSVSYIELPVLSVDELNLLVQLLHETLACLKTVTDDFTSMLVRTETFARVLDNPSYASPFPKDKQREIADFLHWLTDGGFIFLGYAEWKCAGDVLAKQEPQATLGMFRAEDRFVEDLHTETRDDAKRLLDRLEPILVTKLRTLSQIHRRQKLTNITALEYSSDGQIAAVHSFVGLFTSKALSQESSSVPLIRQKLNTLIDTEQVFENSFNYKSIVNIVDSMPKDEAFRMNVEEFRKVVHTIMGIQNKHETRVNLRIDRQQRGLTVLIVLPRDRFNTNTRDRIQKYIEEVFGARPGSSDYHLDLSNKPHARLYFYVSMPQGEPADVDLAEIEKNIAVLSRTWVNNLEDAILSSSEFEQSGEIWHRYQHAFAEDYQALHKVPEAIHDISFTEQLRSDNPLLVGLSSASGYSHEHSILTIYNLGHEISLSQALPVLENVGLEVINERSSHITPRAREKIYVHRFLVRQKQGRALSTEHFSTSVGHGLVEVFLGESENDVLNSLMLSAAMSVRQIALLRTYTNLLWQVSTSVSKEAILQTLADYPHATQELWEIFECAFDPDSNRTVPQRVEDCRSMFKQFKDSLRAIDDITSDKIFRNIGRLLAHTVRTNYYLDAPEIVLKLESAKIDIMPEPRPAYEIFVSGATIQGVHLRGSSIARGGLRWSERYQDFRSEVLGLMKTQRVKNALIVPDGAKGGFVVNNLSSEPEEAAVQVKQGYRTFIRSLLSVTDNRVNQQVVHPERVIILDEPDPYFVVAADKGTATFSDLANEIAVKEFNFWLGDAFASGGSNGYDHKRYGITARGAWECVLHHFTVLGKNYDDETFSVVGIGDMSGDVFGNGMLLSQNILLLAAFNHKHIFIDPNPDAIKSFNERTRLFETPKTQWSDYDASLISPGGGVFSRFDKEIKVSSEARIALSIPDSVGDTISGEKLIRHILRAKVDLLWNGGIGTYVKASNESNAAVNDGTNDSVRVNAKDLQARVVGEGGNLGFTQAARIEFAAAGGLINTDAIDNSAGVDLSDHEVNLKILFAELLQQNALTLDKRNALLEELAPKVIEDVLAHNKAHALVLTVGESRSRRNIAYFRSLIQEVHRSGFINRQLEQLPDDDQLLERTARGIGLSRPELAVCLSAVKLQVKREILNSELITDTLLQDFLIAYFPETIQDTYRSQIQNHPLGQEIIATQVANYLIDVMGVTFVHRMCLGNSVNPVTVIKCALAAVLILNVRELLKELRRCNRFQTYKEFLILRTTTSGNLRDATSWLISFHGLELTLEEMVKLYRPLFESLRDSLEPELVFGLGGNGPNVLERITELHLSPLYQTAVMSSGVVKYLFEMMWAYHKAPHDIAEISKIYATVCSSLQLQQVLESVETMVPSNKWENELLANSLEDLRHGISLLTIRLIEKKAVTKDEIEQAITGSPQYQQFYDTVVEMGEKQYSAAALSVLGKQITKYLV